MHETECLMAIKYMISVLNRDSTMLSEPSTKNVVLGSSGLFHFAILVPDRYSNRLFLEIISGQNVVALVSYYLDNPTSPLLLQNQM